MLSKTMDESLNNLENRKALLISALIIFFLIISPSISFTTNNLASTPFIELLPAIYICSGLALFALLLMMIQANRPSWTLLTKLAIGLAVFWNLQFGWEKLYSIIEKSGLPESSSAALAAFLTLCVAIIISCLSSNRAVLRGLAIYAALLMLTHGVTLSMTLRSAFQTAQPLASEYSEYKREEKSTASAAEKSTRPNVYYVIMDGLGSAATIRKNTGIDILGFQSELKENGFYIAQNARSSYNLTHLTLASIYRLNYLDNTKKYVDRKALFPHLLKSTNPGPPPLIAESRRLGYDFIYVGNSWANCRGNMYAICLHDFGEVEHDQAAALAENYTLRSFLKGSITEGLLDMLPRSSNKRLNNDALMITLDFIDKKSKTFRTSNTFYFVHTLIPHPPHLDETCTLLQGEKWNYRAWVKSGYQTSVNCAIAKMREFALLIEEIDPNGIVIFQGDHGPAFRYKFSKPPAKLDQETLYERFAIFNAIKLPGTCRGALKPYLGNVETIQLVMDCISTGTSKRDFAEPRSYAGFYEGSKYFGTLHPVRLEAFSQEQPGINAHLSLQKTRNTRQ